MAKREPNPANTPEGRERRRLEKKGLSESEVAKALVAKWPDSRTYACIVYTRKHRSMYTEFAKELIKRGIAIDYEYVSVKETENYGGQDGRFNITIKNSTTSVPESLVESISTKHNLYFDCYDDEFRGEYERNPRAERAHVTEQDGRFYVEREGKRIARKDGYSTQGAAEIAADRVNGRMGLRPTRRRSRAEVEQELLRDLRFVAKRKRTRDPNLHERLQKLKRKGYVDLEDITYKWRRGVGGRTGAFGTTKSFESSIWSLTTKGEEKLRSLSREPNPAPSSATDLIRRLKF